MAELRGSKFRVDFSFDFEQCPYDAASYIIYHVSSGVWYFPYQAMCPELG